MAAFRVVLDACVMLPQTLNDLLLTLADAELFSPVWTEDLLDEVERNLAGDRFDRTREQAARRVQRMRDAFPLAEEESGGYRSLIGSMTNHPKDRHVLAAAVSSGAVVIVTANTKDFPPDALYEYGIEAVHPDDFLCDQLDLDPHTVLRSVTEILGRNSFPPQTIDELCESLAAQTPAFVAVLRHAGSDQAERVRFEGHLGLMGAAWACLTPVCVDKDLRSVWANVDPELRLALARKWVADNRTSMDADAWDGTQVATALANPEPEHPLWIHFERVHIRSLRAALPDPDTWGIGVHTRIIPPDLEVLYVHDTSALENGLWAEDDPRPGFPVVMRRVGDRWMVRNLGAEEDVDSGVR